jgi:predicted alpha/beta superfamily hydrolase
VIDGNVYFDVFRTIVNNYCLYGLTPEVILVGIGYKDVYQLDTLRDRDYTYPVAEAEFQMSQSGHADRFLQFITEEIVPSMDKKFRIDTSGRTLFGHSLGGYFVTYALSQTLERGKGAFQNFIAASPSLEYNGYYIIHKIQDLVPGWQGPNIRLYTTFGSLEDEENGDVPYAVKVDLALVRLDQTLDHLKSHNLQHKSVVFSNLAHMETAIPSFVQGLNWELENDISE